MKFLLIIILAAGTILYCSDKFSEGWENAKSSTVVNPKKMTESQMKEKVKYCNAELNKLKAHCDTYIQKFRNASKPQDVIQLSRDFFPPLNKFNCWRIEQKFTEQEEKSSIAKKYNLWLKKYLASYKQCSKEMFAAKNEAINRVNAQTLRSAKR